MREIKSIYSPLHPAAFFMIQNRLRAIRQILADRFYDDIRKVKLLEIGCGNGQWLTEFQIFNLMVQNLSGIELDEERTEVARNRLPGADIRNGNATELPWPDNAFDVVFQSTVFTSVTDKDARYKIASEMKRVCGRGEKSFILWYDFIYDSPGNTAVQGIKHQEISELFTPWKSTFQSVTLAPPLTRLLSPGFRLLAELLEQLCPFLRTHTMAIISPD